MHSFDQAAQSINEDWDTKLDGKQIQRWSEAIGRVVAAERDAEVRAFEQGQRPASPPNAPVLMVIGVDGGRVQTGEKQEETGSRKTVWREDKVATITSYLPGDGTEDHPPKPLVTTYVATMDKTDDFGRKVRVEAERRGLRRAVMVLLIADAGNWIDPPGGRQIAASPDVAQDHAGHSHGGDEEPPRLLFHLFHPAHMLFSAAATAAMFARYERKYVKAAVVGMTGAIVICGISDIVMPHCSLWLLDYHPPLHVCLIEHPGIVIPFAAIGVMVGLLASLGVSRSTLFSHSLHVFASTMASIFYMVGGIGMVAWIERVGMVFFFVLAAVMVPCCLSDIVFPLAMSRKGRELYELTPHAHS